MSAISTLLITSVRKAGLQCTRVLSLGILSGLIFENIHELFVGTNETVRMSVERGSTVPIEIFTGLGLYIST